MTQNPWLEFEGIIRKQLEMQVALSFDRHHWFMLNHGLDRCRKVVDVGTGNGLFLGKVAHFHPDIKFQGIDNQSCMIEEAKSRHLDNVSWVHAEALDEQTQVLLGKADGILMRYVVLHIPNTRISLQRILSKVRPGTSLWIFDIDPDLSLCAPEETAFRAFMDLVRTFCNTHFTEIRTASMLPPILESVGFTIREISTEPFNNRAIGHALLVEYLYREAILYHHFVERTHASEMLQRLEHFFFKEIQPDTHFVQYGMAMIGAVKK